MDIDGTQASMPDAVPGGSLLQDQSRRIHLLRVLAVFVLAACSIILVGCLVALFFVENFPVSAIVVDGIAILSMLAVIVLLSRGRFALALPLGIVSFTAIQFAAMYFLGGARGPMSLLTPIIIMIAGVIGERRYAQPTVTVHVGLYVVFSGLEAAGVLVPYQMPELSSRFAWIGLFIMAAAIMVLINRQFIGYLAFALSASLKREETLAEMSRQVQASAEAEHAAQQQALEVARQLQNVTEEYATFLERIAAGDYSASLDLSVLAEQPNLPQALVSLGEYINTTVASLVAALDEARSAQQTYMRQSWQDLMEARRTPGGYRYRAGETDDAPQVEVDENAWLSPMTRAVHSKDVTVETKELALPIASGTRAQLIGALGVRREQAEAWSEDELALVTTVTDQLAQTLENLRLLDETTRRAAREQMAGEITGRIREAVEIEAVLERALGELGRAFAAERGTVYLTLSEQEEA
jgi:hypothetical protein